MSAPEDTTFADYLPSKQKLDVAKTNAREMFSKLHPAAEPDAYQRLGDWAHERARETTERNERYGTPDVPTRDQEGAE